MTTPLAFTFAGIVLIGVLGFPGRRRPATDLAEWAVGGRRFGAVTMWFLQAGEVFTTFTFLGMAGLAFSGGVAAMYALPYVPIGYVVLFFLAKRLWTLGRARGYLTQGDFLEDRYASPALGTMAAVLGVLFVLPYLQLQITGLGLIVALVTGDAASGTLSMVVGSVGVVAFVLWAGMALMTLPPAWPALMSARDPKVPRRDYTWMPIYSLCLLLPMTIGFAALVVLPPGTDPNGVLLTLSRDALTFAGSVQLAPANGVSEVV